MLLPVQLYYSGECTSAATQEEIKIRFIEILQESSYSTYCTLQTACKFENVKVSCGEIETDRRRRSPELPGEIALSFNAEESHLLNKRSADNQQILIEFELGMDIPADVQSLSSNEKLGFMEDKLYEWLEFAQAVAADGKLDLHIDGLNFSADATTFLDTDWSLLDCPYGWAEEMATFTCSKCSVRTWKLKRN